MLRSLFSIYDVVAGEVTGPIFSLPNDASARRVFQDALTGDGSQLAAHPEDYALHFLGTFDSETGRIDPCADAPFLSPPIVSGADVVRKLAERERPRLDPAEAIEAGVELANSVAAGDQLLARARRQVS